MYIFWNFSISSFIEDLMNILQRTAGFPPVCSLDKTRVSHLAGGFDWIGMKSQATCATQMHQIKSNEIMSNSTGISANDA